MAGSESFVRFQAGLSRGGSSKQGHFAVADVLQLVSSKQYTVKQLKDFCDFFRVSKQVGKKEGNKLELEAALEEKLTTQQGLLSDEFFHKVDYSRLRSPARDAGELQNLESELD